MRSLLGPVHGFPIQAGGFGESLLGEVPMGAGGADAIPDGPAAGGYPVGQGISAHPLTLWPAVIDVSTILGT